MPRMILVESPRSAMALLALRRSLWQLAILGAAGAAAFDAWADVPGVLPAWLILLPLSALGTHHRDAVFALIRAVAKDERQPLSPRRRTARRQACWRGELTTRRRLQRLALPAQHAL